jgi:hypothetical protein
MLLGSSSAALRCIGQSLEKQKIEGFDLKCDAGQFFLQCQDPSAFRMMELRYSAQDIELLERDGQAKRGASFKMVDFDGLPETLRAIGKYVDDKGGHVLRVCNRDLSSTSVAVKLEYQTVDGRLQTEEISKASIYRTMMEMYKDRS